MIRLFNVPNVLTLINLFSGCVGLYFAFNYRLEFVPWCVAVSLIADFLDGMLARALNQKSVIGGDLDSLADVVSFGVLPGAVMFYLLKQCFEQTTVNEWWLLAKSSVGFVITLFAALRLAKFNNDARQTEGFVGLATPASTIFVVGVLLSIQHNSWSSTNLLLQPTMLLVLTALLCWLQIAELEMFAFKFSHYKWSGNEVRYLFLLATIGLLSVFRFAGIPMAVAVYVLISITKKLYRK